MQAVVREFAFEGNQLLFNLDVPARTRNLVFNKSSRPSPLVVERVGQHADTSLQCLNQSRSLQFTAVSENSLNMAVQLAKRDLKKQKEELVAGKTRPAVKPGLTVRSGSPPGRTKMVQSREQWERLQKRQARTKKPQPLVERQPARGMKQRSVQTARACTPPAQILHHNADLSKLPATTNSPPTRDTSVAGPPLTGDAKVMHEIKRLRAEMEKCMKQIKELQHAAKQDAGRSVKLKYCEDIEEARKKKQRAEEQTTRSSRMIYVLNQQVKVIQADLDKMQGQAVKSAKRSQTLNKLASAHRGAVKILQNLVAHLGDYDLKQGMPRSYQELGLLLKQLSLCCAQLEVSGQADVPDSVMTLIKEMADLNKMIDKGLTGGEQKPAKKSGSRSRSPSRETKMAATDRKKEVAFENSDLWNASQNSAFQTEKLLAPRASAPRDEREEVLRRGIQSLMAAADSAPHPATPRHRSMSPPPSSHRHRSLSPRHHLSSPSRQTSPHDVPPLNLPTTPRTGRDTLTNCSAARERTCRSTGSHVAGERSGWSRERPVWEAVMQRNKQIKKGLLLPHHLQRKDIQIYPNSILKSERDKTQRRLVDLGEANYAAPTASSRLKIVDPGELARSREGSPVNSRRVLMGSPRGSPHRGISREEVARQVWEDRQRSKSELEYLDTARRRRQKVEDVSFRLGRSPEWVASRDRQIRSKIEPLISQAEVEVNADLISEMILQDMVKEAAHDVYGIREDHDIHNEACTLQDLPSLETILQRLQQIEEEQLSIRQRWATVVYDDDYDGKPRTTYHDAAYSNAPGSPLPIELTRESGKGCDPVQGIIDARINTEVGDDGAIMFTKTQQRKPEREQLQLSRRLSLGDIEGQRDQGPVYREGDSVYLYLTREIVQSIEENREKFERYLKKMNFQAVGRFNPQKIVEELADEIMADCMQEVSKELWEVNNDIVEATYKNEFKEAGLPTPKA